jgi:putative NADH-flavin reductase
MTNMNSHVNSGRPMPGHVAIIGAAGGLGKGIIEVCRAETIPFTAIVRSRPERIADVPTGSRVCVVTSLADKAALTNAFLEADTVISAMGVTSASQDASALHSVNMPTIEAAMHDAEVERIIITNTLLSAAPGERTSRSMRFFSWLPGTIGRGAREQNAVVDALGRGAYSTLAWTLVRAAVNTRGRDERPVGSADWDSNVNSWRPVSYQAMGRWMLEESVANEFVRKAPCVSLGKSR